MYASCKVVVIADKREKNASKYRSHRINPRNFPSLTFSHFIRFFTDLFFVIFFTSLIFIFKMTNDDEIARIEETNIQVISIFDKVIPTDSIKINFCPNDYYEMPKYLEDMLRWLNINKDEYFRISVGSVDIPKLALKNIEIKNNQLTLTLGITSYYNIFFTHYFADYFLSYEDSMETIKELPTLRRYLSPILKEHYEKCKNSNSINFHFLLPNPLGVTGIICIESNDNYFFILKIRESLDAAAKARLQWSFAGTMDIFPNLFHNFSFEDIVNDELYDEVLNYDEFACLKDCPAKYSLLGITVNELYLFQPEIFVCVHYRIDENQSAILNNSVDSQSKKFVLVKEKKDNNLEIITNFLHTKTLYGRSFKTRNLFLPGYNLLQKYIQTQAE